MYEGNLKKKTLFFFSSSNPNRKVPHRLMAMIFNCLGILVWIFGGSRGLGITRFSEQVNLRNQLILDNITDSRHTKTHVECARSCGEEISCVSIAFHSESKLCQTYKIYSEVVSPVTVQKGWSYFYKGKFFTSCIYSSYAIVTCVEGRMQIYGLLQDRRRGL